MKILGGISARKGEVYENTRITKINSFGLS